MGTAYLRSENSPRRGYDLRALILEERPSLSNAVGRDLFENEQDGGVSAASTGRELQSRPGYRPTDPYASEMRHRDDSATVKTICGYDADK
jgi:hypothetical protein